jgi:hypothetical protein
MPVEDGICDFQYDIDMDSTDFYPLTTSVDIQPPQILDVQVEGLPVLTYGICANPAPPKVILTAFVDDTLTGNSNITGANFTSPTPGSWPGIPMNATMPQYDSPTETEIDDVRLDGQSTLTVWHGESRVTLTALIDDSNTGQSFVGGANYTIGIGNWAASIAMLPSDGSFNSQVENVGITVNIRGLGLGSHAICVYARDIIPNHNLTGKCATLEIVEGPPRIRDVRVSPDPQEVGGKANISAVVTDDVGVKAVWIIIRDPQGDLVGNFSMTYHALSDRYYLQQSYNFSGVYTFEIFAEDFGGNGDSETGEFLMEPGEPPAEYNWKPLIALAFTLILLLLGVLVSHRRPVRFSGILSRDRMKTFMLGVLPFAIAEILTGVISYLTGFLSVPPILGLGMAVDLAILISGLMSCIIIFKRGRGPSTDETFENG